MYVFERTEQELLLVFFRCEEVDVLSVDDGVQWTATCFVRWQNVPLRELENKVIQP